MLSRCPAIPIALYLLVNSPPFREGTDIPVAVPLPLNPLRNSLALGMMAGLLVIGWLVALVSLLLDGARIVAAWRRHRVIACPNCGVREAPPAVTFQHRVVPGTGWEEITCAQCGKFWHMRL